MALMTCYLCGKPLQDEAPSQDHVVPKTLIQRNQPKVKGFDYAGTLPTHAVCNNEFGPEKFVSKALDFLDALHNPEVFFEYPHPKDPKARMMALNSALLPAFTKQDLQFFQIIDAREKSEEQLHELSLIEGRKPVNPRLRALHVALAVLTKSVAALIVSRKLKSVPQKWDVLAIPYVGDADAIDFDDLFGSTEPFDVGVKVWLGELETNDYVAAYRAKSVIVFFLFRFSASTVAWERMLSLFKSAPRLRFLGSSLIEVTKYAWERV
jgi:hypothetical protein